MSDTPNGDISTPPDAPMALLGFVDPADVNRAYESSGWNVEKYVKRLVQIIEDEETPARVVLATAELLRLHALSALQTTGQTPLLTGNVAAEVLPAADLARLEDGAARTQSMLAGGEAAGDVVESDENTAAESRPVEDTDDGSDDQDAERQEIHSKEGEGDDSGGAEAGTGQVSTEDVIGHRPSAGTRRGLCGSRPDSGGSP